MSMRVISFTHPIRGSGQVGRLWICGGCSFSWTVVVDVVDYLIMYHACNSRNNSLISFITLRSDFHYETYIGISPYRTLAVV